MSYAGKLMNLVKYQWEPCKKKKTLIKIFQNVDDGAMCQISAVVFWKKTCKANGYLKT